MIDTQTIEWMTQQPKFRRLAQVLAELAAAADEREHEQETDAQRHPCTVETQTQKGH